MQLITSQIDKSIAWGLPQLLKEFLIGSSYATVQRNLPVDAGQLINLLPVTTQPIGCDVEVKIKDKLICLSQDALWNASMMILSPQQRLVPYRVDIWTKLWDHLVKIAKGIQKFKPTQVVEKLLVSLVCYQVSCSFIFCNYDFLQWFGCSLRRYPDQVLPCLQAL